MEKIKKHSGKPFAFVQIVILADFGADEAACFRPSDLQTVILLHFFGILL